VSDLIHLFREMVRLDASDLHLNVTAPPQIRVRGDLRSIPGEEPLTKYTVRELLYSILTKEQAERLETHWECDFSYSVPGLARWRVNAFFQRGALGAAFRIIPEKIRALDSLGIPDSLYQLCDLPRGVVLVTGPTGSGKSTTLASMIDVINQTRHEHILTVEDPIEFIHTNKNCMVNQREIGADTEGFANALKSALRQDPDVILVGEMRDLETIQIALTAAETGHLVFGTLHTSSAAKTVDRVVDVFPEHQQAQVRVMLASSLMGVVAQTLVPTADGQGRCVACEVLIPNAAIRNLIREGKIFQIPSIMQTSKGEGMQTLDMALAQLVKKEQVTMEEALKRCSDESEFVRLVDSTVPDNSDPYVFEAPARLRLSQDALDNPTPEEMEGAQSADGEDAAYGTDAGGYATAEPAAAAMAEPEPQPVLGGMMPTSGMMPVDPYADAAAAPAETLPPAGHGMPAPVPQVAPAPVPGVPAASGMMPDPSLQQGMAPGGMMPGGAAPGGYAPAAPGQMPGMMPQVPGYGAPVPGQPGMAPPPAAGYPPQPGMAPGGMMPAQPGVAYPGQQPGAPMMPGQPQAWTDAPIPPGQAGAA
jgi:twitching motility protein PilT